ncbi:unnamed protein product [Cuscuta campestris]|uniref:Uncharacterized protein n=1 Tax=Cuscuta campestris TaxID=132261 RepID=A0A484KDI3_9ASTE|nr:unnamed protein product [Cuscuta campestris]
MGEKTDLIEGNGWRDARGVVRAWRRKEAKNKATKYSTLTQITKQGNPLPSRPETQIGKLCQISPIPPVAAYIFSSINHNLWNGLVNAEVEVDETISSTDQIPPFNVADSDDEDPIPRPIGRKNAKSIASGSGGGGRGRDNGGIGAADRDSGGRGAAGRDSEGRALPLAAIVAATTKTRVLQVGKVAEEARLAGMVEALVLLSAVAVAMTTVAMAAGWAEATTVAVLEEVATTSEKCQRRRSTRKKPLADCGRLKETKEIGWKEMKVSAKIEPERRFASPILGI